MNIRSFSPSFHSDKKSKNSFAKTLFAEVKEKTFGELNKEDKGEHEKLKNNEEMYKTYSEHYKKEITLETSVKIIKFKILEKT